jgi:hypothetical protein
MTMAYVAVDRQRARALRDDGRIEGPIAAHAVTPGLLRAHDLGAGDEDAEYTALAYAGVTALLTGSDPLRLVLAAELAVLPGGEDGFGRVELDGLGWTQVTALFADESGSADRVARARTLATGRDFDQVVDDVRIEALLDDSDLLWFAPTELDRLPEPAG